MQLPEHVPGDGDAAGLALTLIRTFGARALPMVVEHAAACVDHPDLHKRWCEIRDALAALTGANAHMEAALVLLDEIAEYTIPPTLVHAIAQLGFDADGNQTEHDGVTVTTCSSAWFSAHAERHLALARRSADAVVKARHLDAAAYYASVREQIDRTPYLPPA